MILSKDGKVRCQVCGKLFKMISTTHLKKHKMSMDDYRESYPDAPITAEEFSALSKYSTSEEEAPVVEEEVNIEEVVQQEIEEEQRIQEIESAPPEVYKPEVVIVTQRDPVEPDPIPEEIFEAPDAEFQPKASGTMGGKQEVLKFIQFYLPNLVDSMYVTEKHKFDGVIEYQTLADFIGLDVCLAIIEVLYNGYNDP